MGQQSVHLLRAAERPASLIRFQQRCPAQQGRPYGRSKQGRKILARFTEELHTSVRQSGQQALKLFHAKPLVCKVLMPFLRSLEREYLFELWPITQQISEDKTTCNPYVLVQATCCIAPTCMGYLNILQNASTTVHRI